MQKLFRTSAWFMVVLLAVGLGFVGCGDDDDDDAVAPTPVLQSTTPASGATVAGNASVTLTFDVKPDSVSVNGVDFPAAKATVVNLGQLSLPEGATTLNIAWTGGDGGSSTLALVIAASDTVVPTVVSSSPANNAQNVEYDGLTEITITFSEALNTTASRSITVSPDGGSALNWTIAWSAGDTVATLTAGTGGDLTAETTYKVAGSISDVAGNKGTVDVTFTTRAKE
jgi:hypothetical protein